MLLSVPKHIQLWNHMVFYYMGSQSTITFGIKSILFTLCLCRYICCSLCTLYMVVSLVGTSGDSIEDMCVVFFKMLIICELQGTTFSSHHTYGIPAYILRNAGNSSYVMRFHTHIYYKVKNCHKHWSHKHGFYHRHSCIVDKFLSFFFYSSYM